MKKLVTVVISITVLIIVIVIAIFSSKRLLNKNTNDINQSISEFMPNTEEVGPTEIESTTEVVETESYSYGPVHDEFEDTDDYLDGNEQTYLDMVKMAANEHEGLQSVIIPSIKAWELKDDGYLAIIVEGVVVDSITVVFKDSEYIGYWETSEWQDILESLSSVEATDKNTPD